ncbi:MAG TPA: PfkB family carbohydrate kinase, partial [Acidimicrobiales bacterium]|nr:PfkB family carbohydrate kinase [Acidimicrobiales bacterium]
DADADVIARLLVPMAAVVTPNLAEAAALLGAATPVRDRAGMEAAAQQLVALGAGAALVTGGHLDGAIAADCLFVAGRADVVWLESAMLDQRHTHGSGCALSAAIAARLARGDDVESACRAAKAWVAGAIAAGVSLGRGTGPVDPGWQHLSPEAQGA